PDDLATHMAYADLLSEQGDPRGEFIQVQLALEDPSCSAASRRKLQQRERELLDLHEHEWLGELAPLLLGTPEEQRALFAAELRPEYTEQLEYMTGGSMRFGHGWRRGWLNRFECDISTVEIVRKLGRAPIARLLGAFVCRGELGPGVLRYRKGPDVP